MIRLIAPPLLLLLATVVPAGATACPMPAKDARCQDPTCPTPVEVPSPDGGATPDKLKCSSAFWFLNGADYIAASEQFECKDGKWVRAGGSAIVASALCVPSKLCTLSGGLDTSSILRFHQPQLTEKALSCAKPGNSRIHIFWPDAARPEQQSGSFSCDTAIGQWKTAEGKPVPPGTKIFCQVPSDEEDEDLVAQERLAEEDDDVIDEEEEEEAPIWLMPATIVIGAVIVVAISNPTAHLLRKIIPRKRIVLEAPLPKAWSKEWEVEEENIEWNWTIVKEFVANWDNHPIEDRARFIDEGYMMLGYQSTITQMLYIFEAMLMVENHHAVWAPMINFLCRLSRLVRPPHTSVDVANKFNTWLSYQGRKVIEEFGYHADDPAPSVCTDTDCSKSHCYSAVDSASETEADKKRKAEEARMIKKMKKKKKEEEEKKKREGAGADDAPPAGKAPTEGTKSKPGSEPPTSSNPRGDSAVTLSGKTDSTVMPSTDGKTTQTAGTTKKTALPPVPKPGDEAKPQERECLGDDDPDDAYLRFVGVFVMTLGRGGLTTDMFADIDAIFPSEVFNIEGPVRAALGASKAARGRIDGAEFLNMVDHLDNAAGDENVDSEWGSAWDHLLYALGHVRDDGKAASIVELIARKEKITPRNIFWWFRGCNEGHGHVQISLLIRHARALAARFPPDSEEYYQCLRQYCLFDHTDRAWDTVEHLVAQCPALAARLNVPEYRRRSQYFTAWYEDCGEPEIVAWISQMGRAADIREAAFIPKSVAAAQRAGDPAPQ